MNVFRILTPCVLQRRRPKEVDNSDKRDCWFVKRRRGDASYMIHRMGASASSSITSVGGDSIQAARLSSSGNPPDQHGIAIRYLNIYHQVSLSHLLVVLYRLDLYTIMIPF